MEMKVRLGRLGLTAGVCESSKSEKKSQRSCDLFGTRSMEGTGTFEERKRRMWDMVSVLDGVSARSKVVYKGEMCRP